MPMSEERREEIESNDNNCIAFPQTYYHDYVDDCLQVHDFMHDCQGEAKICLSVYAKVKGYEYDIDGSICLGLKQAEKLARDILRRVETIRYLETEL